MLDFLVKERFNIFVKYDKNMTNFWYELILNYFSGYLYYFCIMTKNCDIKNMTKICHNKMSHYIDKIGNNSTKSTVSIPKNLYF